MVITNNLQQASFRLRIEALREGLQRRGVSLDVQVRPRAKCWPGGDCSRPPRITTPSFCSGKCSIPRDTRLLRKNAQKLFFDVDDAVMYHSRPVGPLKRWQTWRRFLATARYADRVVAGNEYLAELFRRHGAQTTVPANRRRSGALPDKITCGLRQSRAGLDRQQIDVAVSDAIRRGSGGGEKTRAEPAADHHRRPTAERSAPPGRAYCHGRWKRNPPRFAAATSASPRRRGTDGRWANAGSRSCSTWPRDCPSSPAPSAPTDRSLCPARRAICRRSRLNGPRPLRIWPAMWAAAWRWARPAAGGWRNIFPSTGQWMLGRRC